MQQMELMCLAQVRSTDKVAKELEIIHSGEREVVVDSKGGVRF